MPATASNTATTINMSITFNQPINNLRIRFIDLDENNSGLPQPEEHLSLINPIPSSVSTIPIANPFYLVGNTVTPFDNNPSNNNNNTAGWINWNGSITSVSFRYNRPSSVNAGLIIDSIYFDCPINCSLTADAGHNITLCNSNNSTIDATNSNATSYLWNTGETTPSINVSSAGVYWVEISDNTCTDIDSVIVSNNNTPSVQLGNDTTLCNYSTLTLNPNISNGSFLWSNNTTLTTLTVNQSGQYWVEVSNNCGLDRDTINITFESPPFINLGNDTTICTNSSFNLNASTLNAIYTWQDNSINSTFVVSQAGYYWVRVSSGACIVSDTILVGVISPPNVQLGNDTAVCSNIITQLIPIFGGGNATILWSDNSLDSTLIVNNSGIYWIEVENQCALIRDSISVTVEIAPTLDFGNDTTVCTNIPLILNPNIPFATYIWQDNSTNSTFTVSQTGNYAVTVSSSVCIVSDSITISTILPPNVQLGNDTTVCNNLTTELIPIYGGGNATILWNDNSFDSTLIVDNSGIYWIEVENQCAVVRDSINVTVEIAPALNFGNDTTACTNIPLILNPNIPFATYIWQDNSTNSTFAVSQAGNYWVTVSSGTCIVSDTILVGVISPPNVQLSNDTTVCSNLTTELIPIYGGGNATILWNNNSFDSTLIVNNSGIYWIEVENQCAVVRDSINVTVEIPPAFDLGNDTTICENSTLILNPNIQNATYVWQNNSSQPTFSVNQAGVYWVDVSTGNCLVRDSINILTQNAPIVNLGNDITLCNGTSTVLNAFYTGANYSWQDNSNSPTLMIDQPGTYWVDVSNICGTLRDTFILTIQNPPQINFSNDTTFCLDESISLSAFSQGANYLWQDNSTNSSLIVNQAGLYSVVVTVGVCQVEHDFLINVKMCNSEIEMPTIFTPNGDGINDYFTPVSYSKIKNYTILIVNRWGNVIYNNSNLLSGWDGTSNGKECSEGVYFWKVNYEDFNSSKFTEHGFLHLQR
jgi:gliding motility-associated-like protein